MLELLTIFNKLIIPIIVVGAVLVILGKLGDPKKIKNREQLKKWGLIILVVSFLLMLLQVPTLYSLLGSY